MPSTSPSNDVKRVAAEWVKVQGEVSTYIRSLVHSPADRDDLLQQTILYLLDHAAEYRGEGFKFWALRTARYRILEYWNRQRRDGRVAIMAQAVEMAFAHAEEPVEDGRIEALKICLERLSPSHREMLEKRYISGQTMSQLAAHLARTTGSLAVTFHRLRQSLALCIAARMQQTSGGIA